ncbi:MAG: ParA family protein [Chloroflexota bacterium]
MTVIAFSNRKGGQGKTTMTVNVGAALARKGYRVGLVDTDPQGNVAMMLGLQAEDMLHAAMVGGLGPDVPAIKYGGNVDPFVRVVPRERYADTDEVAEEMLAIFGNARTSEIRKVLADEDILLFDDMIQDFKEGFDLDYVLIDTAPSITPLDPNVYISVDGFVIVSELEELAINGMNMSLQQISNSNGLRKRFSMPENRVLGVITNRGRNTNLHKDNYIKLQQKFGKENVWNPVSLRVKWGEAAAMHICIQQHADARTEIRELDRIVDNIESRTTPTLSEA